MKNKMKSFVVLLTAACLAFSLAACGDSKSGKEESGIGGNTYVLESITVDGVADEELVSYMKDSSYTFDSDGTCVYSAIFMENESKVEGKYTLEGTKATVTLDYGEEMGTVEMEFVVSDDAITFRETSPAYDDEGNEIEGETTTTEQIYKKKN